MSELGLLSSPQKLDEIHTKVMQKIDNESNYYTSNEMKLGWQERYERMRLKVANIEAERDVLESLKKLGIASSDAAKLTKSHLHAFLLQRAKNDKDVRLSGKRPVLLARVRKMLNESEIDDLWMGNNNTLLEPHHQQQYQHSLAATTAPPTTAAAAASYCYPASTKNSAIASLLSFSGSMQVVS